MTSPDQPPVGLDGLALACLADENPRHHTPPATTPPVTYTLPSHATYRHRKRPESHRARRRAALKRNTPHPGRQFGEDTLPRMRRVLGEDHPYTLLSAVGLAHTLRGLGQYQSARQLGEDTLPRLRRVLGRDHPYTLLSAAILAIVLREVGHYERARRLGEDAVARMRRVLGEDHPHTLRSAHSLAAITANLGKHDQARRREE